MQGNQEGYPGGTRIEERERSEEKQCYRAVVSDWGIMTPQSGGSLPCIQAMVEIQVFVALTKTYKQDVNPPATVKPLIYDRKRVFPIK